MRLVTAPETCYILNKSTAQITVLTTVKMQAQDSDYNVNT